MGEERGLTRKAHFYFPGNTALISKALTRGAPGKEKGLQMSVCVIFFFIWLDLTLEPNCGFNYSSCQTHGQKFYRLLQNTMQHILPYPHHTSKHQIDIFNILIAN